MSHLPRLLLALPLCCLLTNTWAQSAVKPEQGKEDVAKKSSIRGEDGNVDMSNFIDQAYGFMPLAVPITEPAVGAGAVGAVAFIDRYQPDAGAGFGRPNITVVGGLGTENGTRGLFFFDLRHWLDDSLQTMVGAISSNVKLDYYGTGELGFLNRNPQSYALDVTGGMAQAKYRLGQSQNWVGMGYAMANTKVTFDSFVNLPERDRSTRIGGLLTSFSHDSRDNLFTPREGQYLEVSANIFNDSLGSDVDFKRLSAIGMQYVPLDSKWYLGLRESVTANYGTTPFYMKPYVYMRGVPAMRYMGDKVAQMEAEVTWQFASRYSALAFVGAGAAASDSSHMKGDNTVTAAGVGMRYEIARKYGMHVGVDVATSRDGQAIYIQFGSAWMRP